MAVCLVRFKVQDYDKWREAFDAGASMRQEGGSKGTHVFFNADDPTDVLINISWEDRARAEAVLANPATADAMRQAGVVSAPDVMWVEDGGRTAG